MLNFDRCIYSAEPHVSLGETGKEVGEGGQEDVVSGPCWELSLWKSRLRK